MLRKYIERVVDDVISARKAKNILGEEPISLKEFCNLEKIDYKIFISPETIWRKEDGGKSMYNMYRTIIDNKIITLINCFGFGGIEKYIETEVGSYKLSDEGVVIYEIMNRSSKLKIKKEVKEYIKKYKNNGIRHTSIDKKAKENQRTT